MEKTEIIKKIKSFLEKESQSEISDNDADLIERGILDSFTMIRLLDFLEKDLKVPIKMDQLSSKNFFSLNSIVKTIEAWT